MTVAEDSLYRSLRSLNLSELSNSEQTAVYEEALSLLPSRSPIYIGTERLPLPERIAGTLRVYELYRWRLDSVYRPRLRQLRKTFRGSERCFIIGNGPSLNQTDLGRLRGEVTFAVNSFFLKLPELDWVPTFYLVEDHLVAEDRRRWINAVTGPTKLIPAYLAYCLPEAQDTVFFNHRPRVSYPHGFDFSLNASDITYTGCTVTFTAMQIAFYLGFRKIHLLGVDASYAIPPDASNQKDYGVGVLDMPSDDPNHFHPDYFGKGFRWHDPQVNQMLAAYEEASRTTVESGVQIINSGVGGELNVFPRVPLEEVVLLPERAAQGIRPAATAGGGAHQCLEPDSLRSRCLQTLGARVGCRVGMGWGGTAPRSFPRLLVVDFTEIGDGSATGELKRSLLSNWPGSEYLQVFVRGQQLCLHSPGAWGSCEATSGQVLEVIGAYEPEAILFRPVAEKPELFRLLAEYLRVRPTPVVTWLQDDWVARLYRTDPSTASSIDRILRSILKVSSRCLSISDPMNRRLEGRYGLPFEAIANGVDLEEFGELRAARKPRSSERLLLSYCGSLAEDMGLNSLLTIAQAVELQPVACELRIYTRDYWIDLHGERFSHLSKTTCIGGTRPKEEYLRTLVESDANVIAYNFDETSRVYAKTSLANKLPECLAAGAGVLAFGPSDFATMEILKAHDCGVRVVEPGVESVVAALRALADDSSQQILRERQLRVAAEHFDLGSRRNRLRQILAEASEDVLSRGDLEDLFASIALGLPGSASDGS